MFGSRLVTIAVHMCLIFGMHLENFEMGLENSWNFFLPKEWEPCIVISLLSAQVQVLVLYAFYF